MQVSHGKQLNQLMRCYLVKYYHFFIGFNYPQTLTGFNWTQTLTGIGFNYPQTLTGCIK